MKDVEIAEKAKLKTEKNLTTTSIKILKLSKNVKDMTQNYKLEVEARKDKEKIIFEKNNEVLKCENRIIRMYRQIGVYGSSLLLFKMRYKCLKLFTHSYLDHMVQKVCGLEDFIANQTEDHLDRVAKVRQLSLKSKTLKWCLAMCTTSIHKRDDYYNEMQKKVNLTENKMR